MSNLWYMQFVVFYLPWRIAKLDKNEKNGHRQCHKRGDWLGEPTYGAVEKRNMKSLESEFSKFIPHISTRLWLYESSLRKMHAWRSKSCKNNIHVSKGSTWQQLSEEKWYSVVFKSRTTTTTENFKTWAGFTHSHFTILMC